MAVITATQVRDLTVADANFDLALIRDETIDFAEIRYLRPVVGADMMADLDANPGTTANAALLTHVRKMLANFVMYEELPYIRTQPAAHGLMQNTPEFAQQAGHYDATELRNSYFHRGEVYRREVECFIDDNEADYPLYDPEGRDNNPTTRWGIVVPKRAKDNC